MSKKKRNRRPPNAPKGAAATAPAPVADAAVEEAATADDTASDAQAAPVVDVALAQAAAIAAADASPEESAAPDAPRATAVAAPAPSPVPSWSMSTSGDIRGVLIQVAGGRLLLPNATIAEVLSYAEPEPSGVSADWLLGRFRWRGWQLPLVAFSRLTGIGEDRPGLGSKVVVLKALGGDARTPYFALLTQGFPRLVTVSRAALGVDDADTPLPPGVQAFVRLNDEPALLPDLLHVESRLREVREAA